MKHSKEITDLVSETEHLKIVAEKDAEIERLKLKNNESFMVFENSNSEEGLVQLSISLKGLDNAREYVKTWKGKRLYIYQFIE